MSLSEKLQWILTADSSGAVKGFQEVGTAADTNLTKAEGGSAKLGGQMTKVGAGAVAFAGVAAVALIKVAGSFEDLALKSGQMSDATGLSVEQASRWIQVASEMGIGADTIESALGKMNKTLGGTPQKFADLGIEIARTSTGVTDVNGTFINTIERLNQIQDPAERATAAAKIFGKGWQGSAELLKLSTTDIKTALQSVSEQKVINPAELAAAKTYRDNLNQLKNSVEDLGLAVGKSAAPVIGDLASGLSKVVSWGTKADTATGGLIGKFAAMATVGVGLLGTLSLVAGQAIKMTSRFTTLGDDGERSLTKMGTAAKGLGIGLGIAAIAMTAYTLQQNHNASNNKAFVTVLDAVTKATDEQAVAVTANLIKAWTLMKDAKPEDVAKRIATENLAAAVKVRDLALANTEYAAKLAATGVTTDMLTAAINTKLVADKKSEEATTAAAAAVEKLKTATDGSTSSIEDAAAATADSKLWTDNYAAAVDAAKKADEEYTKGLQETAKALQDEATAQTAMVDALHAAADANYAVLDATDTYDTFLKNLKKSLQEAKGDQEAINAIYREGTKDADAVATAVANAAAQTEAASGITQTQTEKLDLWNKSMVESASKASPALRAEIINYIGQVNNIPAAKMTEINAAIARGDLATADALLTVVSAARTVAITADADTTQANIDIANATKPRTVDVIPNAIGWTDPYAVWKLPPVHVAVVPGHAAGTTNAEDAFIAGERGPELVTGRQGSTVFTAEQTAAMLSQTGGSQTTTIINHWPPGLNPSAVAKAQRDYQRRGGRS